MRELSPGAEPRGVGSSADRRPPTHQHSELRKLHPNAEPCGFLRRLPTELRELHSDAEPHGIESASRHLMDFGELNVNIIVRLIILLKIS